MNTNSTEAIPVLDYTKCWFYRNNKCHVVPNMELNCEPIEDCKYGVRLGQFFTPYKYHLTLEEEKEYADHAARVLDDDFYN